MVYYRKDWNCRGKDKKIIANHQKKHEKCDYQGNTVPGTVPGTVLPGRTLYLLHLHVGAKVPDPIAPEKGSPWRAFLSHDSNSFLIVKEHLVQLDSIRAKAAADLQTEILHILRCFFIELQNT
jgi:hypothetical protein